MPLSLHLASNRREHKGMHDIEIFSDDHFMKLALLEAEKAEEQGEVPIGAVIVSNNRVIAKAYNQVEMLKDVSAHAEIIALTAASSYLGNKYLNKCTLYVTLEPCIMCVGALKWSQISRIVYGASDEKNGFMRYGKEMLHPKTRLEFGVLHDACSQIVSSFFATIRDLKS